MRKVSLRNATKNDVFFLFELINDSECRHNSLRSEEIIFESHKKWLQETLHSKTRKQYILMDGDTAVGQGRLELVEEGCRISYSIIPERRGAGYGKVLLKLLNNMILEVFPCCTYSYGEALRHNVASQRIFEELGYEREETKDFFKRNIFRRRNRNFSFLI